MKSHLSAVLEKDSLHLDTLSTVISEVEAIVNRRPITCVGVDGKDLEALSPADILYPGVPSYSGISILPLAPVGCVDFHATWKRARALVDSFWKRWSSDYVASLVARSKWKRLAPNIAVGEVVLVVDESRRRDDWKLGRVVDVEGSDGCVRRARVRMADGGIILRDRTKLVRMEVELDAPVEGGGSDSGH